MGLQENDGAAFALRPTLIDPFPAGDTMEATMKAILAMVLAGFGLSMLAACNTMEGAGQDVKAAGQKVENSAAEHKHY